MRERLQSSRSKPDVKEVSLPCRILLFEPNKTSRDAMELQAGSIPRIKLTVFSNVEEALEGINKAYQKDSYPFDKAVIASGKPENGSSTFPAEQIVDELKERGMDPSDIFLRSSDDIVGYVAEQKSVGFLKKGTPKRILDNLSNLV